MMGSPERWTSKDDLNVSGSGLRGSGFCVAAMGSAGSSEMAFPSSSARRRASSSVFKCR
jgi:hypothetical protein